MGFLLWQVFDVSILSFVPLRDFLSSEYLSNFRKKNFPYEIWLSDTEV